MILVEPTEVTFAVLASACSKVFVDVLRQSCLAAKWWNMLVPVPKQIASRQLNESTVVGSLVIAIDDRRE